MRLKRNGKRFEVAAYRNTVVAWRNHVEKDIDEVLQVHTIFANVDKGILAKSEDLIEAFGTDNEDTICVEVLNKGEFQVSEQERQMQVDSLFRDVATKVADMCVHPETHKPYPLSTIERAMRETLHFAPNLQRNAKQQALAVVKQLEASDVLPIARARMHLRLLLPAEKLAGAQAALRALAAGSEDSASAAAAPATADAGDGGGGGSKLTIVETADAAAAAGSSEVAITCHADPGLYRPLSELAKDYGGTLQVVELKATSSSSSAAANSMSNGAVTASSSAAHTGAAWDGSSSSAGGGAPAAIEPKTAAAPAPSSNTPSAAVAPQPPSSAAAAPAKSGYSDADFKRFQRMFSRHLKNAENGDPVAQLEVGKAYIEGKGVGVDASEGKRWLEQAAQQGVNAAISRLEALEIS